MRTATARRWVAASAVLAVCAGLATMLGAATAHAGGTTAATPPDKSSYTSDAPDPARPGATRSPQPTPGTPRLVPPEHANQIITPIEAGGIPMPFPARTYDVSTLYLGTRGTSDYLSLYAGSLLSDPSTGVLVVWWSNIEGRSVPPNGRVTLPGVGELTLTSVSGSTVTLVDASGRPHVFALDAGGFVS